METATLTFTESELRTMLIAKMRNRGLPYEQAHAAVSAKSLPSVRLSLQVETHMEVNGSSYENAYNFVASTSAGKAAIADMHKS